MRQHRTSPDPHLRYQEETCGHDTVVRACRRAHAPRRRHLMGASLVGAVLARWTHVSDTAFRVLTRMALTALDNSSADGKKPAATYWGGRDLLAMSLRRLWPEGDDERSANARKNIHRDVRRAINELIKEGAIEVVDTGRVVREGNRQVYRLSLLPLRQEGVTPPPEEGSTAPPREGFSPPPEEGGFQHRGGVHNPSLGVEGTREGANEGAEEGCEIVDLRSPRKLSARASAADGDEDEIFQAKPRSPGPTCVTCCAELDPDGSCFICRTPRR